MYAYLDKVKSMINIEGDEQNSFVENYVNFAKSSLYEMGVSEKYLSSEKAVGIIAMYIQNIIDDGSTSKTTEELIKSLRTNHPHDEDDKNV